jgi:hypothetical protein
MVAVCSAGARAVEWFDLEQFAYVAAHELH